MANSPLNDPKNKFNLWQFYQGDPVPQEDSPELTQLRFLAKLGIIGWEGLNQLYKDLEVDYDRLRADFDHQVQEADNQRATADTQRLDLTNTIASQQRMLQDQQSTIKAMDHRILTLSSQNLGQETTLECLQFTIADQRSTIDGFDGREKRWLHLVRDCRYQLNISEVGHKSMQLEAVRLEKEVARLADQNERFAGLMERGGRIAAARIEQAIGECEAKLEWKDDKITEQAMLIKSLQAQVSRLESENHELKSGSETEGTSVGDDEELSGRPAKRPRI